MRAPQQYRGQVSGLEAVAGHIPGAVNIPTVTHIDSRGRLLSPDRIRETLRSHGLESSTPVIVYCDNGIASAHSALAFESAGYQPQLYPGGWSQWSRSPGRPIAIGRTPADVIVTAGLEAAHRKSVRDLARQRDGRERPFEQTVSPAG